MRQLDELNAEMKQAGAWVFNGGLSAPSTATVLTAKGDDVLTTDGPFVEGKEYIGGFTHRPRRATSTRRCAGAAAGHDHRRAADRGPAVRRRRRLDAGSAVSPTDIAAVFRQEYGRAVAVLVRVFGDIDIAEEAVQDAFTAALRRWPADGLPPSPAGWIITTARNRAIDGAAPRVGRADRHAEAAYPAEHAARRAGGGQAPCATTGCA